MGEYLESAPPKLICPKTFCRLPASLERKKCKTIKGYVKFVGYIKGLSLLCVRVTVTVSGSYKQKQKMTTMEIGLGSLLHFSSHPTYFSKE